MNSVNPPKLLRSSQVLNLMRSGAGIGLSRLTRRPFVFGSPVMVMIEPGTACQLHCPHCPTGRGELLRPAGRLTLDNFRGIWDAIHPAPLRLQLWNQGEPLINPDLPGIIAHATRSGSRVVLATNVELLANVDLAERIVLSGTFELVLSLDGASRETHSVYRKGGDFDRVAEGIRNVVRLKEGYRRRYPLLTWQFIMFRHNLDEKEQARRLAEEWGVNRIVFKTAQLEDLSLEEGRRWLPDDPRLRRYDLVGGHWALRRRKNYFCDRLFASTVILWNGDVVPCCFDKDGDSVLGNALEQPFATIWQGKAYSEFRQRWIKGDRPAMCDNCTEGLRGFYGTSGSFRLNRSTNSGSSRNA